MGATVTLRRRIDWGQTDAAGFWHHSTFWTFAEAGEAELIRALGLTELVFGHTPRRSVSAEFFRPLYFDDEARIEVAIDAVGRTSVTYGVRVVAPDGELAAEGRMTGVLIGDDGRPRPWPDEARELLVHTPVG